MHGHNLEKVYESFPMDCLPEEYLPDEYEGPNAGSTDLITGRPYAVVFRSTEDDNV